jgi:hypothetical protein
MITLASVDLQALAAAAGNQWQLVHPAEAEQRLSVLMTVPYCVGASTVPSA